MASTSTSNGNSNNSKQDDAEAVYDADVAPKEAILHDPAKLFEAHPGTRPHMTSPVLIIVMGVSGCGKSTVGQKIADKFRIQFVDGDELHPRANVEKMSGGTPLNDDVAFLYIFRYCRFC